MHLTEPYSPWQNMAKGCVRDVKRASTQDMLWTGSPKRLWDHSLELCALIHSHTALDIYNLRGQVPEAVMKGDSPDISHLCEFSWYDWVWYNNNPAAYPESPEEIGRYLGPSIEMGSCHSKKILNANG